MAGQVDNHDEGMGWDEQKEWRDGNKELYVCMETKRWSWLLAALEVVIVMTNIALWWPSCFSVKLIHLREDFTSFESFALERGSSNYKNVSFKLILHINIKGIGKKLPTDKFHNTSLVISQH